MPVSRAISLLPVLVLPLAVLATPSPIQAQSILDRAGNILRNVVELFVPEDDDVEDLDRALDAYAKGHDFTTMRHALSLRENGPEWARDEADLLLGLAATAIGLREPAVAAFRRVLEAEGVSPYYPLALATLLELEREEGRHAEAAQAAERYFANLWARPRTPREATVKARFLELGELLPSVVSPGDDPASVGREQRRPPDRPTERAAYRAGVALLRERRFGPAQICFQAIGPRSLYFPYALFGRAQARYGMKQYDEADRLLREIFTSGGLPEVHLYLRDRAALLSGSLLHEIDENGAAIDRLRLVSREGPFALHAAILSAQILAEKEPALALIYLYDAPLEAAEPKLVARAIALDAELRKALGDSGAAISRLEEGVRVLGRYADSLDTAYERYETLLDPLRAQGHTTSANARPLRDSVRRAVPNLLHDSMDVGFGTRLVASLIGMGADGYPVMFHRRAYDPWAVAPERTAEPGTPPEDEAFPAVFRHSVGRTLRRATTHPERVRSALRDGARLDAILFALDGVFALRSISAKSDEAELRRTVSELGLPERVASMIVQNRERGSVVEAAIAAEPNLRVLDLQPVIEEHLSRWSNYERSLLAEVLHEEEQDVRELRYVLELELSNTLALADSGPREEN